MESVMSITDAAVNNINKTSAARSYEHDELLEVIRPEIDTSFLLSPTSDKNHTAEHDGTLLEEIAKNGRPDAPNLFQMLVDGDHESLNKSTPRDILNSSLFSNVSHRSHASSTASSSFLTGQAQKVKVSAKLLKQVKSPFSDGVPIPYVEKHISDQSGATEVHPVAPLSSCEYLSDEANVTTASIHSGCSQVVIDRASPVSVKSKSSAGGKSSITEPNSCENFNLNNHSNHKGKRSKLAQGSFVAENIGSDQDVSFSTTKSCGDLKLSEEQIRGEAGKEIWNTGRIQLFMYLILLLLSL